MDDNPAQAWLLEGACRGASDLHLIGGYPPVLRLHGRLIPRWQVGLLRLQS